MELELEDEFVVAGGAGGKGPAIADGAEGRLVEDGPGTGRKEIGMGDAALGIDGEANGDVALLAGELRFTGVAGHGPEYLRPGRH